MLLRFRRDRVAFVSDIEAMFPSFKVNPEHRDYLRFYWFQDNDSVSPLAQYRAKVHIFGNVSSPAVANFCLRYAGQEGRLQQNSALPLGEEDLDEAQKFVDESFYVDDGLGLSLIHI